AVTFNKWKKKCFLKSAPAALDLDPATVSAFVKSDVKPSYSPAEIYVSGFPERGFPKTADATNAESADDCLKLCLHRGGRPIRAKTYVSVLHAMLWVGLAAVRGLLTEEVSEAEFECRSSPIHARWCRCAVRRPGPGHPR